MTLVTSTPFDLKFILIFIFLTILFVIVLMIIFWEFSAYKKRIDDGKYFKEMKKEMCYTKKKIPDRRLYAVKLGRVKGRDVYQTYYPPLQEQMNPENALVIKNFELDKQKIKKRKIIRRIVSCIVSAILIALFAGMIYLRAGGETMNIGGSIMVTVETPSMSYKNELNTYLVENNLNDQLPTHTLITLEEVTETTRLNKYDIAAYYDKDNRLIIHRIIDVKNAKDGKTYYTFKGDANVGSDYYLVEKGAVKYKYTGRQSVFWGFFVTYLRSVIGMISIAYTIVAILVLDITESKKEKYYYMRVEQYSRYVTAKQIRDLGAYKYVGAPYIK